MRFGFGMTLRAAVLAVAISTVSVSAQSESDLKDDPNVHIPEYYKLQVADGGSSVNGTAMCIGVDPETSITSIVKCDSSYAMVWYRDRLYMLDAKLYLDNESTVCLSVVEDSDDKPLIATNCPLAPAPSLGTDPTETYVFHEGSTNSTARLLSLFVLDGNNDVCVSYDEDYEDFPFIISVCDYETAANKTLNLIQEFSLVSVEKSEFDPDSTSVSPSEPSNSTDSGSSTSVGLIIGIVVGVAVVAFVAGLLVVQRRRAARSDKNSMEMGMSDPVKVLTQNPSPSRADFEATLLKIQELMVNSVPAELVITKEQLTLQEQLANGNFGAVYNGVLTKNPGASDFVAAKVPRFDQDATANLHRLYQFAAEARYVCMLAPHDNIIACLGVCMDPEKPMIAFEKMSWGDAATYLRNLEHNAGVLNYLDYVATQVARGMQHIHEKGCIHRDLALRNILIGDQMQVKIGDFGLMKVADANGVYRESGDETRLVTQLNASAGEAAGMPVRWMAPESLLHREWSFLSDIWSFGILLYEIYNLGTVPYFGHTNSQVVELVPTGQLSLQAPEMADETIVNFVFRTCLSLEKYNRPSFEHIVRVLENQGNRDARNVYVEDVQMGGQ
eukprot:Clim_evm55s109 gene=Clim_evmTU55s109